LYILPHHSTTHFFSFLFNDPAPTDIYTLSLHDALPISNPNASAPSKAAITTSRPVRRPPSTRTSMRSRSLLRTRIACVSARPSSHGDPACLIDDSGDAPVPPLCPEMST